MIVVDRIVLGRAIVPEGDRARLPDEAAGEFRPGQVLAEEVEQRLALRLGHVLEAGGVGDVDEERLAAGLRMGADDRVLGLVGGAGVGSGIVLQPVLAGLRHVRLGRGRDPDQAVQHPPHARRQGLVGEVHVGEERVAAVGRDLAGEQDGAHRRLLQVGGVGVPDAAEIHRLVLALQHLDDLGMAGQPLDERILDRPAEGAGEGEELVGRQVLVAEEDHEMVEQRLPHRARGLRVEPAAEVEAGNLRPERARHLAYRDRSAHRCVPLRSIAQPPP